MPCACGDPECPSCGSAQGTLAACQCEHAKHGAHGCYQARGELPEAVRTAWGTFLLCKACRAEGCMPEQEGRP